MVLPLDWPPIPVNVHASNEQLEAMIKRVERNFEYLGQTEPHWSVLTSDRFLSEHIRENEEEFFLSGRVPVQQMQAAAARCGLSITPDMTCLELGCGVGRSTIWLADLFGIVLALDVSRSHIALADLAARQFGKFNVMTIQVSNFAVLNDLPRFDFFFSFIVLQHNPPPVACAILATMLNKLRPGGAAYFQVPTYRPGYGFDPQSYLATEPVLGQPEMHTIPQPELYELLRQAGCSLLEVREDEAAGAPNVSARFLVRKN